MKQGIRKKHLKKRNNLSKKSLEQKSKKIAERLFRTEEFKKAETIMAFVSINNEPETRSILEEAWRLDKRVCVPLTNFSNNEIIPVEIKNLAELEEKKFGLLEPKNAEKKIAASNIDLVLVPGVAFDCTGNRLGYGKGFFDRFLEKARCNTIGLCFEQHLEQKLPAEQHDKKVGKIITEKRTINCFKN